jgi:kynureninase
MSRNRAELEALDAADPLAEVRTRFRLPAGRIYLDGNSLGALPEHTGERLDDVIARQWGRDLITSWSTHGWFRLAESVGDAVGGLLGAAPGQVVVCDSISVNLFKLLTAALRMRPERRVILSERANFPTDLYIAQGLDDLLPDRLELRLVETASDALEDALDDDVAVMMLTHVGFRTGRRLPMERLTRAAHEAGALALWDLAHTAGAMPVDLDRCGVDLAVGCGYKYLNGGPGAPAFAYVARRHHEALRSPLWGWMGHAEPFAFDPLYRPAKGVRQLVVGTPPILSLAALAAGVELFSSVSLDDVRRASVDLTELFIELVEDQCAGFGLRLVSPRDPDERGSQVAFAHDDGYPMMQALIDQGVIGDFRAPDLLRFGFAPLYIRRTDVLDAVTVLRRVLDSEVWRDQKYQQRSTVT